VMSQPLITTLHVTQAGRLDRFLAVTIEGYTRSFFQRLIQDGHVTINGSVVTKAGYNLKVLDTVEINFAACLPPKVVPFDGDLGVKLLFEHPDFLIVEKPVGLVVHKPFPLFTQPTLVDWLVASFPHLKNVGLFDRPGIVHRLDKDTSGLMVVARNNFSLSVLGQRFKDRQVKKTYIALVHGTPPKHGIIDEPIGRHVVHKHKMTTDFHAIEPRPSCTHFETIAQYEGYAAVACKPITGRTHQIRVHMSSIGYPLLGDLVYGGTHNLMQRHALHAYQLAFEYGGKEYLFTSDIAPDMHALFPSYSSTIR
jgi:23S rRNA pseudouridine1911/1915/1917 synthase